MLTDFLILTMNEMNFSNYFFQQDGATCHYNRPNTEILRANFQGNLISRFGDVEWPARSPEQSPLDYLLREYLKGKVYRDESTNFAQLKSGILDEIELITPELTSRPMSNLPNRAKYCLRSGGQHTKEIIFKKQMKKKTIV